ncbi:MAG: Gfo/Idh/MocA family protein, partial [Bullifex sp.]
VEIAGVFDSVTSRAEELAGLFGGKVYSSVDELLDDETVDLVSVCVANAYHADVTVRALKKGKHVLCEKPMAISPEDCERMVAAAHESGKRLFIGHNQRLTPAHRRAKELIASGEMGKVLTFNTMFCHGGPESWSVEKSRNTWFFKKSAAAFGSMADLGIHKIDLIRYLVGDEISSVYSQMRVLDKTFEDGTPIEVDDNSVEILSFKNGAFGTVTTSWTCYGTEFNTTNIFCQKGVLKLYSDPEYSLIIVHADGREEKLALDRMQTNSDEQQASSGVIDEVVDSILSARASILDADDIICSMKAVFACQESEKTGTEATLK